MKVRTLQLKRALSAALFVLLLSVVGMMNALAQTQIATLQHNDSISVYYGINALVSAHTAAATGDVITLSEGSFNCCDITKAITLRGAGCRVDTLANTVGTTVSGDFKLNVSASNAAFLNIEGILFPGKVKCMTLINPRFIRCNFNHLTYSVGTSNNGIMQNAQFINCFIQEMDYLNTNNTTFINSVIYKAFCYHNNSYGETYHNSIVRYTYSMSNAVAYNSIIIAGTTSTNSSYFPASSSTFFNCIGIKNVQPSVDMFQYQINSTNMLLDSIPEVFATWTGGFSYEENFILNYSIASSFLGNDGTEVGIHGGSVPYDPRPSYMVVKRYNVANKSDHEGKLSVNIELISTDE